MVSVVYVNYTVILLSLLGQVYNRLIIVDEFRVQSEKQRCLFAYFQFFMDVRIHLCEGGDSFHHEGQVFDVVLRFEVFTIWLNPNDEWILQSASL